MTPQYELAQFANGAVPGDIRFAMALMGVVYEHQFQIEADQSTRLYGCPEWR